MSKDLTGHAPEEDIQVANKQMQTHSTHLSVIRERKSDGKTPLHTQECLKDRVWRATRMFMYIGPATLENSLSTSTEATQVTAQYPSNSPKRVPRRRERVCPHEDRYKLTHSCFVYKSQKLGTTNMPISSGTDCGICTQWETIQQLQLLHPATGMKVTGHYSEQKAEAESTCKVLPRGSSYRQK